MKIKINNSYYLKNDDLVSEIMKFKKTHTASEKLGQYLLAIANNLSTKGNFHGYTWKQDMVSSAVLTCIMYLKNYNKQKSPNAFAYVTQICWRSFVAYIKSERKHSIIKDTCYKRYDEIATIQGNEENVNKAINYMEIGTPRRKKSTKKAK